jgi:general secretion pathway protein N
MNFLRLHPFMSAAAVLAVALLVVIGIETGWGTRVRPAPPAVEAKPGAPVDARVLPTLAATVAEQAYPESVARPLFVPSRRPAPVAPTVPVATMPKGTLTLQGVTIAGETRIAMLREKQSGKVHRVEQGKAVNGMSVAQVDADRVVLRMGDESETVVMLVSKAGGAPGTPGAAPPAPPPQAASTSGPFAPSAPVAAATSPTPMPQNLIPPQPGQPPTSTNPAARGEVGPGAPGGPASMAGAPPQPNAAPMTPEELLARRRARRNPQ